MRLNTPIGLAILLASTAVNAQPVTSPASCAVRIARAPDDVRAVVEDWIRAEPRCSTALEVRIIATDGGLYILAQDEHGRTRERIVPDAQSAGVLIASWVADDAMYVPRPVPMFVWPREGGVEMQQTERPPSTITSRPEPTGISKWVGLGAMMNTRNDGGGLRADVDILTRGAYTLSVAGSTTSGRLALQSPYTDGGEMTVRDVKLVVGISHTWQHGRAFARLGGGAGAVHTNAMALISSNALSAYGYVQGDGWFPTAEAAAMGGVELGRDWSLTVGPMVTVYSQRFDVQTQPMTWQMQPPTVEMDRNGVELMIFAGLKYRL